MPVLRVTSTTGQRAVRFAAGVTLREILDTASIRVPSACGGLGACGRCRVRIEDGVLQAPSASESRVLTAAMIERGWRLACQLTPSRSLRIRLDAAMVSSPPWRRLSAQDYVPAVSRPARVQWEAEDPLLGAAVDVGTTHLRVSVWNMRTAERLGARCGLNPQGVFGADVLTRLAAAVESGARRHELGQLVRAAIGEALREIALQDGVCLRDIGRVEVVGNTAMLALLTGKSCSALLDPDSWTREIACKADDMASWARAWGIAPDAAVHVAQPVGGFVGSDLLAGVLATRLLEGPPGSLLIDFGTNSEIALWDGRLLWVTSAAGGPAFEGCGISCGMPSEPGAIFRVDLAGPTPEFALQVIGGGEPRGLCGSGLVDAVACLLKAGVLSRSGRLSLAPGRDGVPLVPEVDGIRLTHGDIDAFQRAKAAISAAILCLMGSAGLSTRGVRRLCVSGAFGQFLDLDKARDTGVLPATPPQVVELCGNTSLAGAELLLFTPDGEGFLAAFKRRARLVNMAQTPEFEHHYIDSLFLRPMADVPASGADS